MRDQKLKEILDAASAVELEVANLAKFLGSLVDQNGAAFQLSWTIRKRDASTAALLARIASIVGVVSEFRNSTRADLAPNNLLDNLRNALNTTRDRTKDIISYITSSVVNQGGPKSFNESAFQIILKNNQGVDVSGQFHNLYDAVENLLNAFFDLIFILKPKAAYSFHAASAALEGALATASEQASQISADVSVIRRLGREVTSIRARVADEETKIAEIQKQSTSDRQVIVSIAADSNQKQASIKASFEAASSLDAQIASYKSTFEAFQKALDLRNAEFEVGSENLAALHEKLEKQDNEISSIIKRSEEMLSAATVAGLASNFAALRNDLTKELNRSRAVFYVGIVFLSLSALPLLAFISLPVVAPFLEGRFPGIVESAKEYALVGSTDPWRYIGQVISKVIILFPAAWFVSFAAVRHSSLFRLREHYAYKYSMAVSVEGFKKEAPEYKDEIAALVLEELAFNPADKLGSSQIAKEVRAPGVISRFLMDKLRKRIEKLSKLEGE